MATSRFRVREGAPNPLGAHWDVSGVNFAIFSANATRVELCLFGGADGRELARVALPEFTHEVWHGYLPEIRPGQLYGYRVHSPNAPETGPPLHSQQAAARPLRARIARRRDHAAPLAGNPDAPMGDEIGRSQSGNNNSFCRDTEMNWLAWQDTGERDRAFLDFVAAVVGIRRSRQLFRQRQFLHGSPAVADGTADVAWLRPDGGAMQQGDREDPGTRSMAMLLAGPGERLLMLFNAHHQAVGRLPAAGGRQWRVLLDTEKTLADRDSGQPEADGREFKGRSLVVVLGSSE